MGRVAPRSHLQVEFKAARDPEQKSETRYSEISSMSSVGRESRAMLGGLDDDAKGCGVALYSSEKSE
jgi:hypothetical protein